VISIDFSFNGNVYKEFTECDDYWLLGDWCPLSAALLLSSVYVIPTKSGPSHRPDLKMHIRPNLAAVGFEKSLVQSYFQVPFERSGQTPKFQVAWQPILCTGCSNRKRPVTVLSPGSLYNQVAVLDDCKDNQLRNYNQLWRRTDDRFMVWKLHFSI